MKERKSARIIIYILYSVPIPFSLLSWIGTLITIASIGMIDWTSPGSVIEGVVSIAAMLAMGTYIVTYIISLVFTTRKKKLTLISLLPLFHIVMALALLVVWNNM